MPKKVVADTGPLVALFDGGDRHHQQATDFISHFEGELVSTLAVITEVCHLLDFNAQARLDFLEWTRRGGLTLAELDVGDFDRLTELMQKYADLPMDFADATLLVLAERLETNEIITIDRDFTVYRLFRNQPFLNVFLPQT